MDLKSNLLTEGLLVRIWPGEPTSYSSAYCKLPNVRTFVAQDLRARNPLSSFFLGISATGLGARVLRTGFTRPTNSGNNAGAPGRSWLVDLRRFSCRLGCRLFLALSSKLERWERHHTKVRILCHTNGYL